MKNILLIIILLVKLNLIAQKENDSTYTESGYIIFEEWGNGYEGDFTYYFLPIKEVYKFDALTEKNKKVSFHLYKHKRITDYSPIIYNCYLNDGFKFGLMYSSCCENIRNSISLNDSIIQKKYINACDSMQESIYAYPLCDEKVYNSQGTKYKIQIGKAKITYCWCNFENNIYNSNVTYGYLKDFERIVFTAEDKNKMRAFFNEVFKVQKKLTE
jgi:hypothetical protein